MRYIAYTSANPPGLLQKIVVLVATVAMAGVALMFSAVLLAGIVIVGMIGGAWLWWRTREVRKQMRQMQEAMQNIQTRSTAEEDGAFQGDVFEGEVISVKRSEHDAHR
jgi:hypothetical protein